MVVVVFFCVLRRRVAILFQGLGGSACEHIGQACLRGTCLEEMDRSKV